MTTTKTEVATPDVLSTEVDDFLVAQERYFQWQRAYPAAYEALMAIQQEYNATLEAAEKLCRAQGRSEGPFIIKSSRQNYDAEKLFDELGKDQFIAVGGVIENVVSYSVDKTVLQSKIASRKISPEVVEAISKPVHVFAAPKKLNIT